MLIILYLLAKNVILPQLGVYAMALVEPVMVIIITIAGITILFRAVGINISNNLSATIIGYVFIAIGYIVRTTVQAIGWVIRHAFRLTPNVYRTSRDTFLKSGVSNVNSNILAAVVVVIFWAILI